MGAERVIPDPPAVGLFVVAALALLLVPGPAVLYVVTRSMQHGRRAGLVSVLGIHVGDARPHRRRDSRPLRACRVLRGCVHGCQGRRRRLPRRARPVDAVLVVAPSPRSHSVASETFVARSRRASSSTSSIRRRRCSSSPSSPQFVDPNAPHPAVQIAFLGVLFALLGLVTDSAWALAAGHGGWDAPTVAAFRAHAALRQRNRVRGPRRRDRASPARVETTRTLSPPP